MEIKSMGLRAKTSNDLLALKITKEGFLQSMNTQANGLSPEAARTAVESFVLRKVETEGKAAKRDT